MIYFVCAWAVMIVLVIIWYFVRRKRINALIKRIDDLTIEGEKLLKENDAAQQALDELTKKITVSTLAIAKLDNDRIVATQRAAEAKEATERLLKSEHERAAAELKHVKELEEEKMKHEFGKKEQTLTQQYTFKKQQFVEDFEELQEFYWDRVNEAKATLDDFAARQAAIHEAIIRERAIQDKEDFYRINIKENDIKDIEVLRSIESRLTNREVLNKLIYEVFIKRPLSEMEKRVLQGRKIGGIYKITYIKTGEAYIGRSVDIANRWKEHCLSSLNIGTIAHSTFHNVLADKGLQNFTWEVLEEVERDKQALREKYWIEFYQTDKQFNQKVG